MDFSTREISTILWLGGFFLFALTKPPIRKAFGPVFTAFSNRIILVFLTLLFTYVGLELWLLRNLGLWDLGQLKTTSIWLLFVAPATAFRTNEDDPKFFGTWVTDNLKIVAALEFLSGEYTFSIWIELVLVPFATLLTLMIAVAKDPKQRPAKAFLEWVLAILVLTILVRDVRLAIADANDFLTLATLQDFLTEPLLSLAFMPFLYAAYTYASYERIFVRVRHFIKDADVQARARHQACQAFGPNIRLLDRWSKAVIMHNPSRPEDVAALIAETWDDASREKYPRVVPLTEGWCPFTAVAYLRAFGLKPGTYRRHFDGSYFAQSMASIDVEIPRLAHLTYDVDGRKTAATRLELELYVTNASEDTTADARFFEAAGALLIKATGVSLSTDELAGLWARGAFIITSDLFVVEHEFEARTTPSTTYERKLRIRHSSHVNPPPLQASFVEPT